MYMTEVSYLISAGVAQRVSSINIESTVGLDYGHFSLVIFRS